MDIKTQLIPVGTKRRSGLKLNTKNLFFIDHDTGNPNSTAQNNVTYFIRTANEISASAHVFIDDKGAIICIPCLSNPEKAWHVIYEKPIDNQLFGADSNDSAIGLELCYFPNDKARSLKAYENYIEFAALLAVYHKVNPTRRAGHFEVDPERKSDPENALKCIGKTYAHMKKDIVQAYNRMINKQEVVQVSNTSQEVAMWAKEAQRFVTEYSISDGERPKENVTREELWTMLYRFYQALRK